MGAIDKAKDMMGNMDMDKMRERYETLRGKMDRGEASADERNECMQLKSKLGM